MTNDNTPTKLTNDQQVRATPGSWQRNGTQITSIHADEDGEHETLICDVFDQHGWWRANAKLIVAAPKLLDGLFHIKLLSEKSGDHQACPFALLDMIADVTTATLASASELEGVFS